ncbi:hypothetical protein [Sphingobium abikonense]|uniref:hypothetical protein n=1 Tax=Sphingobium abikonense TaxID=86193 RepID=UPI003514416F
MSTPWIAGVTTGPDLVARIRAAAARQSLPVEEFLRPLVGNKGGISWLKELGRAHYPLARTIIRVSDLVEGRPITPARTYQRQPSAGSTDRAVPVDDPVSAPIDREPCFKCGVRGDIGCRHRPAAPANVHGL